MWPITRYSLRAVQHNAHDLRTPKHEQGLYAQGLRYDYGLLGVTDTAPRGFGRLRGCG